MLIEDLQQNKDFQDSYKDLSNKHNEEKEDSPRLGHPTDEFQNKSVVVTIDTGAAIHFCPC